MPKFLCGCPVLVSPFSGETEPALTEAEWAGILDIHLSRSGPSRKQTDAGAPSLSLRFLERQGGDFDPYSPSPRQLLRTKSTAPRDLYPCTATHIRSIIAQQSQRHLDRALQGTPDLMPATTPLLPRFCPISRVPSRFCEHFLAKPIIPTDPPWRGGFA